MDSISTMQAIVVGFVNYGDSDRIGKFLTSERGLVSAIAKRIRTPKHKWSGLLDIGNIVEINVSHSRNDLYLLKGLNELGSNGSIRSNLHKLSVMLYCCEVAMLLSVPEDNNPKLFGLLKHTLKNLNTLGIPSANVINGFAIKALTINGIPPRLDSCDLCSKPIVSSRIFHTQLGSMLHSSCIESRPDIRRDSLFYTPEDWVNSLQSLLRQPLHKNWESNFPSLLNGKRSSVWLLTEMIEHVAEHSVQSKSLLHTLYP